MNEAIKAKRHYPSLRRGGRSTSSNMLAFIAGLVATVVVAQPSTNTTTTNNNNNDNSSNNNNNNNNNNSNATAIAISFRTGAAATNATLAQVTAFSGAAGTDPSCQAIPNMGVTDAWCQANCPAECPAALCKCGSGPAPGPSPGPPPGPGPAPGPGTNYTCDYTSGRPACKIGQGWPRTDKAGCLKVCGNGCCGNTCSSAFDCFPGLTCDPTTHKCQALNISSALSCGDATKAGCNPPPLLG